MKHTSTVSDIRARFPALARRHKGYPVAYFDGPGGTQVPRVVGEAMTTYLYHHNANTHWAYPSSQETDEALSTARRAMADFLNAPPEAVAFGANMTSLTFHLARSLGRQWAPGDEMVVTDLDHHANIDPWYDLAAERQLEVKSVPFFRNSGQLDYEALERALTYRTRLVAFGAASNALGTVNDVPRITAMARNAGALSFVDAVHYAPHVLPDVEALGCDFLACSPYKFYGPHAGVLFGQPSLLGALKVPRLKPAPDTGPDRLETGTLSHEAIIGSATAVDFLASLGHGATRRERLQSAYETLHQRASAQCRALWNGLNAHPNITLFGPNPHRVHGRTPTVGFTVNGYSSESVSARLADRGLFLSHGDFYAPTVIQRLGVEGLVRAGCTCYTTDEEIQRLIDGVRALP